MKVGILGAGQLARMMILGSKNLGLDFALFCQSITATTKDLAEHHVAEFNDQEALKKFCDTVDVITFETENIPTETIDFLKKEKPFFPPKEALLTAQDRLFEKKMCQKLDIPTNQFRAIDSYEDLLAVAKDFAGPLVLKSRRFGYDGKFQYRVKNKEDLLALKNVDLSNFLAESFVPFSHEVSIIGVRSRKGEIRYYDLCHNIHREGILRETKNKAKDPLTPRAEAYLKKIMEHFDYVGVLTLEFFVKDDDLVFNEMAPRVHNSGHWTIEGSLCSQFENHVRAVSGLPLGETRATGSCKMVNCIAEMVPREATLEQDGFYHDYQKTPRTGRKLGHLNYISSN